MAVESWPRYGKTLRSYGGPGKFRIGDIDAEGTFAAALKCDGSIQIKIEFIEQEIGTINRLRERTDAAVAIDGTDSNTGMSVSIRDAAISSISLTLFSRRNGFRIEGVAHSADIGKCPARGSVLLKFGLTNFEFMGRQYDRSSGLSLSLMPLAVGSFQLMIRQIPDYKHVIEALKAEGTTDVTCELEVMTEAALIEETVFDPVEATCTLLSLARGTSVAWIYRDVFVGQELAYSSLRHNSLTPWTGMPAIPVNHPETTGRFVEMTYDHFTRIDKRYQLRQSVQDYCSSRMTMFPELRSIRILTLLDFFCGRVGETGTELVLQEKTFKKVAKALRETLRTLSPGLLTTDQLEEISVKLPELNRRTFATLLAALCQHFEVPLTQQERGTLVKTRHSLVHRGSFVSEDVVAEYLFVADAFDRILLRMVGYIGPYLSAAKGQLLNLQVSP